MGDRAGPLESVERLMNDLAFYRGKSVFVTGHTGFKGSWLCRMLVGAGAKVTGFSLDPPTTPDLFSMADLHGHMEDIRGDIRDFAALKKAFDRAAPEIVLHLAAQPIVRESYRNPAYTYETNVMGTVHILECVRMGDTVRSFLNVTTDKVYHNNEWVYGYRETELLDGFDPYSNSKSCSELVTHSYRNSFFSEPGSPAISTARAGNVIGGGDFAADRIVPDCIRAISRGESILVRNPNSTRPYQHVLEPLAAYLMIAEGQARDPALAGWYNVGPDECDCVTTGELADLLVATWGGDARWECGNARGPHEANFLKLDCSKLKAVFGWQPRWHIREAVRQVCDWSRLWLAGGDIPAEMDCEIEEYYRSEVQHG